MVEGGGFEPPKLSRQIYSLIPLTAREPLQFCGAKFCQRPWSMSTDSIAQIRYAHVPLARDQAGVWRSLLFGFPVNRIPPCADVIGDRQQEKSGAATKNRTRDLLITNQLLYLLSYSGTTRILGQETLRDKPLRSKKIRVARKARPIDWNARSPSSHPLAPQTKRHPSSRSRPTTRANETHLGRSQSADS